MLRKLAVPEILNNHSFSQGVHTRGAHRHLPNTEVTPARRNIYVSDAQSVADSETPWNSEKFPSNSAK